MKISKVLSYLVLVVGLISAVLLFLMNSGFDKLMTEAGTTEARELPLGASIPEVNPLYNLALVVIVLLIIATIISVISGLIKNPSSLKKTLLGAVAFLIVLGASYAIAGVQKEVVTRDGDIISANTVQWVDAGIIAFYVFGGLAIASIVWGGISKSISK